MVSGSSIINTKKEVSTQGWEELLEKHRKDERTGKGFLKEVAWEPRKLGFEGWFKRIIFANGSRDLASDMNSAIN